MTPDRNDVAADFQYAEVIGPRLHHLSPLFEILGSVISRSDLVGSTCANWRSVTSGLKPISFRIVEAVALQPWPDISSFAIPTSCSGADVSVLSPGTDLLMMAHMLRDNSGDTELGGAGSTLGLSLNAGIVQLPTIGRSIISEICSQ